MAQRAANDPAIQEFARTKQPLDGGRVGQPADLDGAVVYLLSDESGIMTGSTIDYSQRVMGYNPPERGETV